MVEYLVYKFFFWMNRIRKKNINKQNYRYVLSGKFIDYIEAFFNLYLVDKYRHSTIYGITKNTRDKKIIISLTSFPKRINTVWITIETLMRQSVKADKIILWLAEEQFNGLESLPNELLEQQKRGLEIRFCDDLRSHKKYFYAMQEYPNDLVILADDDMFYPSDTVKKLLILHKKHPNDICVMTSQIITPCYRKLPSKWRNPYINEKVDSSTHAQVFTGSGSLFIPNCLDLDAFNKELLKALCPYADDLWLTFMALKKGTKISSLSKWRAFPITIYGTSEDSLWYINADQGKNDEQWQNLMKQYPDVFDELENLYETSK